MTRYFIRLAYNGTPFHGWQIQENTTETVQQYLNLGLSRLSRESVETIGCGRTDTGVHASDFYAHVDLETKIADTDFWIYKLNKMLPQGIAVYEIYEVDQSLHARFSAIERTYQYKLHAFKNPFLEHASWYFPFELDLKLIDQACLIIKSHDDFACFAKLNHSALTTICKIKDITFVQNGNDYLFEITADRFLRNMVRAIVGTIIEVGRGKISLDDLRHIIANKNRSDAGQSAPAHGLTLTSVKYT